MNLFRLDNNPLIAARYNQDLHCRKILLEASQLLANCYSADQLVFSPYTQNGTMRKHSHIHHPISKWVKETYGNFTWTLRHANALTYEFEFRFGKKHFCESFIFWCAKNSPHLLSSDLGEVQTEQPQCFKAYPQCIVNGDPVAGYRNYYRTAKKSFDIRGKTVHATWTKREVPEWFKQNEK